MLAQEKPADLAGKPQWQRLLKCDDDKKAKAIAEQIEGLEVDDDYEKAIKTAKELVLLRSVLQRKDYYKTIAKLYWLKELELVEKLDIQARQSWRRTNGKKEQAEQLRRQARYSLALVIQLEILRLRRSVPGDKHMHTVTTTSHPTSIQWVGTQRLGR
ncbi:hypothetical protein [Fimbriiglobus ruber]|uniref:hypothetical protein n=1 Tax=Fimbriiglobus ruber TaxID=1908690 RepID=UPI001179CD04|nr:hypothetical protein [Fimbriiglobus ruber]